MEDSSTGTTTSSSVLFFIKEGACVCFIGRNLRIDGTRWNNGKSTCEILYFIFCNGKRLASNLNDAHLKFTTNENLWQFQNLLSVSLLIKCHIGRVDTSQSFRNLVQCSCIWFSINC